ncbi:hypothetical protein Tco_1364606, partial [Tanacetum coccineum]
WSLAPRNHGGIQAQTRSEGVSNLSSDPPLSGGHTLGSGEDSMEHQIELTDNVPNTPMIYLSQELTHLEVVRTAKEKGFVIKNIEDSSRPVRTITTLQPLPTVDPKDKGKGILQETEFVEKTKKKARMDADYELAARMTQEEQERYTIDERAMLLAEFFERRKKHLAAERVEAIRNKPPTKTQLRNLMMTYLKNMGGYKHSQLKGKSYEEI